MQVDLSANFFELFGLPLEFSVDQAALTSRFRKLQTQLHPDRFTSQPDVEKRWSMQAASAVNEGFQTLSSDLRRAVYLLTLNDISVDEETDTNMAPAFLMEQMEYRESLEAAMESKDPLMALDKIRGQIRHAVGQQRERFAASATEQDWKTARTVVRQWQFLDKLSSEIKSAEERLDSQ